MTFGDPTQHAARTEDGRLQIGEYTDCRVLIVDWDAPIGIPSIFNLSIFNLQSAVANG